MGLFSPPQYDAEVEKATSEQNITERWGIIMEICDKVYTNPSSAKECLKSIMRRLGNNDPHIVLQALVLLDACINNCGKNFHLEVASREFENEFKKLLSKSQPQVVQKMCSLLKSWAENDFKSDPQLNLIPSLYEKLKNEGQDFSDVTKTPKATSLVSKDPNVVSSQQEEEDIAKAIELSLKDAKESPKRQQHTVNNSYSSLYPSFNGTTASSNTSNPQQTYSEPRKVRALYDFEAAEENELTFVAGDIIHVLDDSDPNWWKGYNEQGEGLFPSNFVTADLSVEPERFDLNGKFKKSIDENDKKQNENLDKNEIENEEQISIEINEEKIDRLLHILHEANPEDASQDTEEMLRLEIEVNRMGPLIDNELERVDRKHAQLTKLSSDLVDAINLYHTLMRENDRTSYPVTSMIHSGAVNYLPNTYATSSMVPSSNIYQQGTPSTSISQSGALPIMHMIPNQGSIPQIQQQQSSQPPMAIVNNQILGYPQNLPPNLQQNLPLQYPNGHTPSHLQQNAIAANREIQLTQQQQQNVLATNRSIQLNQQQQQPQNLVTNPQMIQPNTNQNLYTPNFHSHPTNSYASPISLGQYQQQVNFPQQSHPQQIQQQQQQQRIPPHVLHNTIGPTGGVINQQQLQFSNNHNPLQLPTQMVNVNQPVTQTILGQNDSKMNIPLYQQQR